MRRAARRFLLPGIGIAAGAALLFGACSRPARRSILLITLDTTRVDRLGCYGGGRGATPSIDSLAASAIRFETALCQAPITRPSHASILSSQYPRTHGVLQNFHTLSREAPSLARFLRERGYHTAAFTSVRLLSPEAGFDEGFDRFDPPTERRQRPAEETVRAALAWLDRKRAPFFLWVHLFDAHFPYDRSGGAEGTPPLPPYEGPIEEGSWEEIRNASKEKPLARAEIDRILRIYEARVSYDDYWLGKLFDRLREMGLWKETELFLLTDHGEGFEHGVFLEHVNSLYAPVSRIAFLWKRAGKRRPGRVLPGPVRSIDLFPTIAALLGVPAPAGVEGRSLLPPAEGEPERLLAITEEPVPEPRAAAKIDLRDRYFEGSPAGPMRPARARGERLAVTDGVWKYIFDTEEKDELYHLPGDPEEARNRIDEAPADVLRSLQSSLLRWREAHPAPGAGGAEVIDEETRALLESLGYL